jgi:hypothetical protein
VIQVGAAQAYVEAEFGGPVDILQTVVATGAAASRILQNNPERLSVTFFNLGANDVYLLFDDSVSATKGIALQASGGAVNMTVRDDQMLPTREWWVISPSGASTVIAISTQRYAYQQQLILI